MSEVYKDESPKLLATLQNIRDIQLLDSKDSLPRWVEFVK